ncbi:hypothetical protein AOQ87_01445 [Candidatus Riesia pediculischaeffi]|uniref:Uncharacterized protein n=1 Tax=Candidatus Riesia pediculischaeffi TaxID=428411 RepID=A0A1V0HKI2_9ENTR|nr:hypothetical protein AOQ87_01445 [Candidatus Riesia pediculischaeffi]
MCFKCCKIFREYGCDSMRRRKRYSTTAVCILVRSFDRFKTFLIPSLSGFLEIILRMICQK